MAVKVSEDLNVNNILKKISEYDIFKCYCKNFKELGRIFISELREDHKPTCNIFKGNKSLIYKDYNGGIYNCFQYIQQKYSVDFNTCLNIINRDFNLALRSSWNNNLTNVQFEINQGKIYNKKIQKKDVKIDIKIRNYSKKDKIYWEKYKIKIKTLKLFKVVPIEWFWINKIRIKSDEIAYSYEFENNKRDIYQPYNTKNLKWLGNTLAKEHIYGLSIVDKSDCVDILFITSSLKEVMFLYELGFDAIAPQSENSSIPEEIIKRLGLKYNFIYILYDFDKAGCLQARLNFEKYLKIIKNIDYLKFCPVDIKCLYEDSKDLTDLASKNYLKSLNIIKNLKNYL